MRRLNHCLLLTAALCLALPSMAAAQSRHFSNWVFGVNCRFSWDASNKLTMSKSPAAFSTGEGCATYSDPLTGKLLLYTDGQGAWNALGTKISTGYLGGHSSGQYSGIILPVPGGKDHYYVFANYTNVGAIRYSRFDMSGTGKQVGSVSVVGSSGSTNESMQIIPHSNRRDFWLLSSTSAAVLVASITPKGVGSLASSSMGGSYGSGRWGPFRVSNNRRLLVLAQGWPYNPTTVSLFDLDPATGKVSNRRTIAKISLSSNHAYGAEFSPDDTKIYLTRIGSSGGIYQVDLSNANKVTYLGAVSSVYGGAPTLAVDGKIYVTQHGATKVGVISKPNAAGAAAGFKTNALSLPSGCTSQLMFPTAIATYSKVALDADKDTIADDVDLDADNDGVLDKTELGGKDLSGDTDSDGVPDYADPHSVTCVDVKPVDGFCDTIPASVDADGDKVPNHLDLDADNDGIPDLVEAGGVDTNSDGRVDKFSDLNKDGLHDALATAALPVPDTDKDNTANYLDLDSDGDKALDLVEGGGKDADKDGRVDSFADSDGDGLHDALTKTPLPLPDSDKDGDANYVDLCADGLVTGAEACDDDNGVSGDGCSKSCAVESGWSCQGTPSVCLTSCGDGIVAGTEQCDDKNTTDGDGCSKGCTTELGWSCAGAPSTCQTSCGDGIVAGAEQCDDKNTTDGDGCSKGCTTELGWSCAGAPSTCQTSCGDGIVAGAEQCDDKNTVDGDGCSKSCTTELGWSCKGTPSVCEANCGDGIVAASEQCDDKNNTAGDGCSKSCTTELGWSCAGAPSVCQTSCGDGILAGTEQCDDKNTVDGDGCSKACATELGWTCAGAPSVCQTVCGDGIVAGTEQCDDKNKVDGDGCSRSCATELGWSCTGSPSVCKGCTDSTKGGVDIGCAKPKPACNQATKPTGTCVECTDAADCQSGVCDTTTFTCAKASCTDKTKNGAETDVDCGGGTCPRCADTKGCAANTDCESGLCDPKTKTCQPLCPKAADKKDCDGDGLSNKTEDKNGNGKVDAGETDPLKADTDGGSVDDGTEVNRGTDPLDPSDDKPAVAGPTEDDGGCSCRVSRAPASPWLLGLSLLGLLLRRRSRRAT